MPSPHTPFARHAHQSAAPTLRRQLAGAWTTSLGESGVTLRDLSGRGVHGALQGAPLPAWTRQQGRLGLEFDGSAARVAFGAGRLDNTGPVTIALWINCDATSATAYVISVAASAAAQNYSLGFGPFGNTTLVFTWGGTFHVSTAAPLPTGQWARVVAVRRGAPGNWTAEMWVNGRLVNSASGITTNPTGSNCQAALGWFGPLGFFFFDGRLADVSIATRAWTAAEIARDYADSLAAWRMADEVVWGSASTVLPPGLLASGMARGAA